jgi:hypothetical protein
MFPHFFHMRPNRFLLLIGSMVAALVAIILQNKGVFPLDVVTFSFFSFVLFLFALYRPAWTFLLFVAFLPLETVDIGSSIFAGLTLRPYQWLMVLLFLAVLVRLVLKKLPFQLFQPKVFDVLPVLVALGAYIAAWGGANTSLALKQAIILSSFVALYFLGRIFLRTFFDVAQALLFFLASGTIVLGYAVFQNIQYLVGQESFQVMVGRPNATFPEADWLGMFALVCIGIFTGLLSFVIHRFEQKSQFTLRLLVLVPLLLLSFVVLILTVARSAWLGTATLLFIFSLGFFFSYSSQNILHALKKTLFLDGVLLTTFAVACGLVVLFHLSPFQFLNRIQSTGTGLQKITVSCDTETVLPEKIGSVEELDAFGCYHIALEDITQEKERGRFVTEVYREDPNFSIRQETYQTVWDVLRQHPLTGIGWGNIASFLGKDERGASLNSSNMFLEVWLGSGLLGILSFVSFWVLLIGGAGAQYWKDEDRKDRLFALTTLSLFAGITIFNLFNAGLLLGFFFLFLAVSALSLENITHHHFIGKNLYE